MISPVVRFSLRGRSERRAKGVAQAAVGPDRAAVRAVAIPTQARDTLIREAAYFRAGRRGFAPGQELEDWFEAEREVDGRLSSG